MASWGGSFPPDEVQGVVQVIGEHGGHLQDVHDVAGEIDAVGVAAVIAEHAAAVAVTLVVCTRWRRKRWAKLSSKVTVKFSRFAGIGPPQ